jgi:FKBP-type peptidyl-prolyl cis-trans isomerase FkpA
MKNLINLGLLAVLAFSSCTNTSTKKTKDGLEYRIVKDASGDKHPQYGDFVSMHIRVHVRDSVLLDSRKMNNGQPVEMPLMPPSFKGDWVEGVKFMTAGDSAIFFISADTIKKLSRGGLPDFIKNGDKIQYDVILVSIKSKAEAEKEQEKIRKEQEATSMQQREVDDKILQDHLAKNNVKAQKTPSGVYYIIDKPGSGDVIARGQQVAVKYTGKTLDGKPFDSNIDPQFGHTDPFRFTAGSGEVIPGWDEGVLLLKKGSKAKLYIPSPLAYGPQSPGPGIPANAILMFDIEVLDVKTAVPQNQ